MFGAPTPTAGPGCSRQLLRTSGADFSSLTPISDYDFGHRIIVEHLPTGTRVAATWGSREAPNLAVMMQLIELNNTGFDRRSGRITVDHLPGGTKAAGREAKDLAGIVQLIEPLTTGYDRRIGSNAGQ